MTMNTDAMPTQTLDEQAATLQRVYDLVGMGALARTPGILLANLENMKRRADCLSGIEQLFTYEVPDEDMPGEMIDECNLNWGHDRGAYVEAFKAAIPAFIARQAALSWTSVTDQLPRAEWDKYYQDDFSAPVAVMIDYNGHVRRSEVTWRYSFAHGGWVHADLREGWKPSDYSDCGRVTHWAPLPEPLSAPASSAGDQEVES